MSPRKYVNPLLLALTGEVATVIFRGMVTLMMFWMGTLYHRAEELFELPIRVTEEIQKVDKKLETFESSQTISKAEVEKQISEWYSQRDSMQRMLDQHDRALAILNGKVDSCLETLVKLSSQLTLAK